MLYKYDQIKVLAEKMRDIPLVDVLSMTGAIRDKADKRKWHTSLWTISITGQKFMNWNFQSGGGGAIDLVIHLKQLDFKSAVFWLAENFPNYVSIPPTYAGSDKTWAFHPPQKIDHNLPIVVDYLNHKRRIPLNLIKYLIDIGKLYADIKENAVFLLLNKERKIVGAELRGTSQNRWLGMSKGSRKDLGAFSIKAQSPKNIVICESAIDAISYFALHPDCIAVSTSGATPCPAWLFELVKLNIETLCGFDDDETGNKIADKMIQRFPKIGRIRPQKHDWNEVLKYSFCHPPVKGDE
jgi:hypothetical protein